jgi:UDP-glucuronate decarboxylase
MNIIVTGGAGFIGRNLISKLLLDGNKVWCIDNLQTSSMNNIKEFGNSRKFAFLNYDIINNDLLKMFMGISIDQIYHLACPASPELYQKDSIHTLKTCFQGTLNVLELARDKNARILFTSTSEIYGDPQVHPQVEEYNGNVNTMSIRSCYDEGKRVAETLAVEFHRNYGLEIRIARIFNTYGPYLNRSDGRVVSNFIVQALENSDITVYGSGSQTRSFCYVDDNVNGLMKLMDSNNYSLNTQPINIGNDDERTILDVAKLIIKLTESKSEIKFYSLPQNDPKIRCPNLERAKKEINWEPSTSFEEGLLKTIKYFK